MMYGDAISGEFEEGGVSNTQRVRSLLVEFMLLLLVHTTIAVAGWRGTYLLRTPTKGGD